jgi:hypothetical protein
MIAAVMPSVVEAPGWAVARRLVACTARRHTPRFLDYARDDEQAREVRMKNPEFEPRTSNLEPRPATPAVELLP